MTAAPTSVNTRDRQHEHAPVRVAGQRRRCDATGTADGQAPTTGMSHATACADAAFGRTHEQPDGDADEQADEQSAARRRTRDEERGTRAHADAGAAFAAANTTSPMNAAPQPST